MMRHVTRPDSCFRIKYIDRILDNVHGYIELTPIEREIINLPIFKRLQSIKQLSLVNWIFPGAEHTRYTHSLGVMFLADKMAYQLGFHDGDRQLIRLAGLLHDIGHYPLSHVGESAYKPSKDDYSSSIQYHVDKTLNDINKIAEPETLLHANTTKDNQYHHESLSARIIENSNEIKSLITRYCNFINPLYICDIIIGKYSRFPELSAMIQLMHSDLDADRIDYLLRDSSFSGANYGVVDIGIIIKNLDYIDKFGVDIIGIKPKGISAADQYLLSRFFSKSQVICNRHVSALEFMAESIIRYLADREFFDFPKTSKILQYAAKYESDSTYIKFTDHLFWNAIYTLDGYNGSNYIKYPKYIIDFAHMLAKHREIKTVEDTDLIYSDLKNDILYDRVKKSASYINLYNNHNGSFDMFLEGYEPTSESEKYIIQKIHIVNLTDKIPEAEYTKRFIEENGDVNIDKKGNKFECYQAYRLQDGLSIIDKKNGSVHLMVDDERSLLKNIYPLKQVIFHEYSIYDYDE